MEITEEMGIEHVYIDGPATLLTTEVTLSSPKTVTSVLCNMWTFFRVLYCILGAHHQIFTAYCWRVPSSHLFGLILCDRAAGSSGRLCLSVKIRCW